MEQGKITAADIIRKFREMDAQCRDVGSGGATQALGTSWQQATCYGSTLVSGDFNLLANPQ